MRLQVMLARASAVMLLPAACSLADLEYLRDTRCAPHCGSDAGDASDSAVNIDANVDAQPDAGTDAPADGPVDAGSGIVLHGASFASPTPTDTIVLDRPPNTTSGDLLVVMLTSYAQALSAPAGWTPLLSVSGSGPCENSRWLWLYRFLDAAGGDAEPDSYSFPLAGATNASGVLVAYGGIDDNDPIDAKQAQNWLSTKTESLTTSYPGDLLLAMFGNGSASGWDPLADDLSLVATSGPIGFFAGIQQNAGPTGVKTATPNSSGCAAVEFVAFKAK